MNQSGLCFFTIVAQNYLSYAVVLGESVLRFHPDATFSIFILDDLEQRWRELLSKRSFQTIYPQDIPLPEYRKFVFQYNVTEASTGVKPFVFQFLFEHGAHRAIYLDPDILCFRRFDEVLAALEKSSIVLTPHICSPIPEDSVPSEKGIMNSGVFNLGFIALCNGESSKAFLSWWATHLRNECIMDIESGFFVDQRWVDLVPACFDGVFILRNPAYNIAYWNLHERSLEERGGFLYEARSNARVAFIHFSGVRIDDLNSIAKYAPRNPFSVDRFKKRYTLAERPDLDPSFRRYKQLLLSEGMENYSKISYFYDVYENGERITQLERSLYLASRSWQERCPNPFSVGAGSFWQACRKAGIRTRRGGDKKLFAGEESLPYKGGKRIVERFLRLVLRMLGPQRYLQFAKYMRYQLAPSNHGFLLQHSRTDLSDTTQISVRVA